MEEKLERLRQKVTILEKLIEDTTRELFISQERLNATNLYLTNIISSMVDMLIIIEANGVIKMVNKAASLQLGYNETEMKGSGIESYIPEKWSSFFDDLIKTGSRVQQLHWIDKNKVALPVLTSGAAIRNETGEVMSYLLLGRDMREHNKIQSQLMHSHKMAELGELFAFVSHEINSPLGAISMQCSILTDLISKTPIDVDASREVISYLAQTNERVATIVRELNSFMHNADNVPFSVKHVKGVVQSALAFSSDMLARRQIKLHIDIDKTDKNLILECRPAQLSHVVLNLVQNAADAVEHEDEKWIRISARSFDDKVALMVTDSGKGINESVRERIFEPFFTTKDAGTGFGLNVCKKIIEKHNGVIFLDITNKNTCFEIDLPKIHTIGGD